jgi:hypothetical protein
MLAVDGFLDSAAQVIVRERNLERAFDRLLRLETDQPVLGVPLVLIRPVLGQVAVLVIFEVFARAGAVVWIVVGGLVLVEVVGTVVQRRAGADRVRLAVADLVVIVGEVERVVRVLGAVRIGIVVPVGAGQLVAVVVGPDVGMALGKGGRFATDPFLVTATAGDYLPDKPLPVPTMPTRDVFASQGTCSLATCEPPVLGTACCLSGLSTAVGGRHRHTTPMPLSTTITRCSPGPMDGPPPTSWYSTPSTTNVSSLRENS